jgi:hypothetical protein
MTPFSPAELAAMRATQSGAMMDTCLIMRYISGVKDEGNVPVNAWRTGESVACGFNPAGGREVMEQTQVAIADAQVRLPISTTLDSRDRIKITHRFGEQINQQPTYEVIGLPERGPSGLLLNLRLVTDGSDGDEE